MINLTSSQLRKAADLQDQIAMLQTQLAALVGVIIKPATKAANPVKRGMSAAGRARIAAAAKLRWAKVKAAKTSPKAAKPVAKVVAVKPAKKKRGKMSAAGRARIVAAQKLRWSKIHAAKATPKAAPKVAVKPVAAKSAQKLPKKKFKMSAAAKAKISAAAKLRWAKIKAGKK